jgi:hypothetical protein
VKDLLSFFIEEIGLKQQLSMNPKLVFLSLPNFNIPTFLNARDLFLFLKYFFIPVLIVFLVSIVMVIVFRRYRLDRIDSKRVKLEDTVDNFLTEILFSDYTDEELKLRITFFKKGTLRGNKKLSQFVLQKLLHIKQNVQQMNQEKFILIYEYFGFSKLTKKLLADRSWVRKSEGIMHYQILDYKEKKTLIEPFLLSQNKALRSNALIAMISLSDENFDVLDHYDATITRAEEFKILDLIYQKEVSIPTNISSWLKSSNESIVIIAIKLAVRYKFKFTREQLNSLLANSNPLVRKEIIIAIRELKIEFANPILMSHYKIEKSLRNKISIIKTFQKIGNPATKDYALRLLSKENDLDLKFEIVNCIYQIDRNFFSNYQTKDRTEAALISKMLLHHKSPYINS